jgi:hypothetical protein
MSIFRTRPLIVAAFLGADRYRDTLRADSVQGTVMLAQLGARLTAVHSVVEKLSGIRSRMLAGMTPRPRVVARFPRKNGPVYHFKDRFEVTVGAFHTTGNRRM